MVYFLTNKILPNYTVDETEYLYPVQVGNYGRGVALELLEINHAYWILHNNDVKNITITTTCEEVTDDDIVVFYNCSNNIARSKIDFRRKYKKIQIVTDQPIIDGCDAYICYDPSVLHKDTTRKWFHILYPMPRGLKKCEPVWPPSNITCISPDYVTISPSVVKDNKYTIISDSYVNTGREHVLFHVRKPITFNESRGIHTRMKFPSHKTANRLYQAWYCNIPGVFSSNAAMNHITSNEYDFLIAENDDELNRQIDRLCTDEKLYMNMVANSKKRENENNYDVITEQWLSLIQYYETN